MAASVHGAPSDAPSSVSRAIGIRRHHLPFWRRHHSRVARPLNVRRRGAWRVGNPRCPGGDTKTKPGGDQNRRLFLRETIETYALLIAKL